MLKDFLSEIITAIIIIVLLVVLINPMDFLMPSKTEMMLVTGVVLLFGIFVSFMFRENTKDERESMLRMMADRMGFLAGAAIVIVGIIVESLRHQLSDWMLMVLAVMMTAKIAGVIYGRVKK
ncbi:MAG: hypothetical protein COV29_03365 [Candidatus Yanofskybacteria bacterium CG10_big_fil_rev_8_21_14_0_10_36_16]|uniref:DUF2178 domain-containing protein n=1 Tax=Candidatus Yanofskybacteria bacterium CG10_big_fil_rev_8_21_14_0_10_36_16 TaxID=1975096 RepID=A0A2J0QAN8_9BACT|nr:MAG: hypothetical protein COV29_03365 [Candidatus Yanofskybacteria bacterium CG10_big_fil_rev_8_21_14_0_10_36_16]